MSFDGVKLITLPARELCVQASSLSFGALFFAVLSCLVQVEEQLQEEQGDDLEQVHGATCPEMQRRHHLPQLC